MLACFESFEPLGGKQARALDMLRRASLYECPTIPIIGIVWQQRL